MFASSFLRWVVVAQFRSFREPCSSAREQRVNRAGPAAKIRGDVLVGEIVDVSQGDGESLARGQPANRLDHRVTKWDDSEPIPLGRDIRSHFKGGFSFAAQRTLAECPAQLPNGDLMGPGVEGLRVPKTGQPV